ncbi:hypothetical protein [Microbacterium sp. YY-01]|uniref:hypothetical protein n=1 Tax=Microbacterium sp. YY-01 TaxID=3421634 RepID=UPI003D17EC7F
MTDVHQMVEATSLSSIEYFKMHAERDLSFSPDAPVEVSPSYILTVDFQPDGERFRVLFETDIETTAGHISCGVAAEYAHPSVILRQASGEAISEFVNNVALMHLIPYVRNGVADITQRVFEAPLLMPIFQRGELNFDVLASLPKLDA